MIRNVLHFFIFTLFFLLAFSTEPSPSGNNLHATADVYANAKFFNGGQDYYDVHYAEMFVAAPQEYYGWYHGTATVNIEVNGETLIDDDDMAEYYGHGVMDTCLASIYSEDAPNQDLRGSGHGWGTIYGTPNGSSEQEEAYDDIMAYLYYGPVP